MSSPDICFNLPTGETGIPWDFRVTSLFPEMITGSLESRAEVNLRVLMSLRAAYDALTIMTTRKADPAPEEEMGDLATFCASEHELAEALEALETIHDLLKLPHSVPRRYGNGVIEGKRVAAMVTTLNTSYLRALAVRDDLRAEAIRVREFLGLPSDVDPDGSMASPLPENLMEAFQTMAWGKVDPVSEDTPVTPQQVSLDTVVNSRGPIKCPVVVVGLSQMGGTEERELIGPGEEMEP